MDASQQASIPVRCVCDEDLKFMERAFEEVRKINM